MTGKLITAVAACVLLAVTAWLVSPRYQFSAMADSAAGYKLDIRTGQVWFCKPDGCSEIAEHNRDGSSKFDALREMNRQ